MPALHPSPSSNPGPLEAPRLPHRGRCCLWRRPVVAFAIETGLSPQTKKDRAPAHLHTGDLRGGINSGASDHRNGVEDCRALSERSRSRLEIPETLRALMSWFYRTFVRPALFAQDSEAIHERTMRMLARASRSEVLCELLEFFFDAPPLPVELFGLK